MRAFIDSVDGRKTTFYDRLNPNQTTPRGMGGALLVFIILH